MRIVWMPLAIGVFWCVPAAAQPNTVAVMETYFECLVGDGAAAMHFQAMRATDAFADALAHCADEESAVHKAAAADPGEEGELDPVESVQQSVIDMLNRLDTGYDPFKPTERS